MCAPDRRDELVVGMKPGFCRHGRTTFGVDLQSRRSCSSFMRMFTVKIAELSEKPQGSKNKCVGAHLGREML